ncbi:MAG: hypothetical protein PHR06_05985 [Candidatus Cloacimonetes bacterium]|nr:hypothetical protein [Candidatus Cloacimonadota bacterium]
MVNFTSTELNINTIPSNRVGKNIEALPRFGTLTLVNCLPKDYTAKELYEIYKQRNEMEGWLMANFLTMIAYFPSSSDKSI